MNKTKIEQAIKDRLETGFKNWNGGYECWLEWCKTLYEPDCHYNIQGRRLTFEEYKGLMGKFFDAYDITMGDFHNMIIEDNWCAIRYDVIQTNKKTGVTETVQSFEFVQFKENPDPIGVRVVEGWALSESPIHVK